jgi:siroheme synthase
MGFAQIGGIAERLVAAGLPETTPVAAVQSGTTPRQRHMLATLGTIGETAALAGGPVLFIIGRVVALAPARAGCHALAPA